MTLGGVHLLQERILNYSQFGAVGRWISSDLLQLCHLVLWLWTLTFGGLSRIKWQWLSFQQSCLVPVNINQNPFEVGEGLRQWSSRGPKGRNWIQYCSQSLRLWGCPNLPGNITTRDDTNTGSSPTKCLMGLSPTGGSSVSVFMFGTADDMWVWVPYRTLWIWFQLGDPVPLCICPYAQYAMFSL